MSKAGRGGSFAVFVLACGWALAPAGAFAQPSATDEGEVAIRTGAAFGGGTPGLGTQPFVAGSSGIPFSRWALAVFDISYTPAGNHSIQGWPAPAFVDRSHLWDFGFDLHIRVPVRDRLAPYGIAGVGMLWNRVQQQTGTGGSAVFTRFDQWNGAVHTGGGVRYYIGENWGVRPEVKVTISKQVYTSIGLGLFYVLPR